MEASTKRAVIAVGGGLLVSTGLWWLFFRKPAVAAPVLVAKPKAPAVAPAPSYVAPKPAATTPAPSAPAPVDTQADRLPSSEKTVSYRDSRGGLWVITIGGGQVWAAPSMPAPASYSDAPYLAGSSEAEVKSKIEAWVRVRFG